MIVCADDYGLAPDIDEAILTLCSARRLSGVSCMAALDRCSVDSFARLSEFKEHVDLGLHLCFTHEPRPFESILPSTRLPYFSSLLKTCFLRRGDPELFLRSIQAQYDLFLAKAKRPPDFIDGHLHTHQLPQIREALLDFVNRLTDKPYTRNTRMNASALRAAGLPWLKAIPISIMGLRMQRALQMKGLRTNAQFAGIYDFQHHQHYTTYLPKFVSTLATATGLLVTHPGRIEAWRSSEFNALSSFPFPAGEPCRFPPG